MTTYAAKILEVIPGRPDVWNSLRVGVFRNIGQSEEQIGEYHRNYGSLFNTFFHCSYGGKDYALYSPNYTITRIMELPSCKDIGGEEPHSSGFCPVDFYVPRYIDREYITLEGEARKYRINEPDADDQTQKTIRYTPLHEKTGERYVVEKPDYPISPLLYYSFGFVAGCIWGDDSSWKIQFLDLSEITRGFIKRDERFGYIELPEGMALKQAVNMGDYRYDLTDEISYVTIAIQKRFDLASGKMLNDDPFA